MGPYMRCLVEESNMNFGKLFYLRHCQDANEGIVEATLDYAKDVMPHMTDDNESDVQSFVEYWEQFYPEDGADVIQFLKTKNIVECGTIEQMGLDYFWVEMTCDKPQ